MITKRYRSSCYVDQDVDVFEFKDDILEAFSDKELENELKRRNDEKKNVTKSINSYYINTEIDISDYSDEILEFVDDDSLINELEDRDMYVYDKSEIPKFEGNSKKLAKFLGLREWATKKQILEEINYFIKDDK